MLQYARWLITSNIKQYPRLYLPLVTPFKRDFEGKEKVLSSATEILIEAYPRSGNTFARFAFEIAQNRPVRIAHHLHASAHVIAAVKRQVPALVIIRNPKDAVLSHLVYSPSMSASHALIDYRRFYESVRSCRHGFVLAKFETVTQDFGLVIAKVNERFKKEFAVFQHTPENEKLVFQKVKTSFERTLPSGMSVGNAAGLPMDGRQKAKQEIGGILQIPQNQRLFDTAMNVYDSMSKSADI
jgi:hypothetical protein